MYLITICSDSMKQVAYDPTLGEFMTLNAEYKIGEDHLAIAFAGNERTCDAIVDNFTRKYPGMDIGVFKQTQIHLRPAGERVIREVSEKGILPV